MNATLNGIQKCRNCKYIDFKVRLIKFIIKLNNSCHYVSENVYIQYLSVFFGIF